MLNNRPKSTHPLIQRSSFRFGLGSLILHYIRTLMNRVRWEQNREMRSLQTRGSNVPRSTEQANKLFIATEQAISLSEEARLQRIDQILGTKTHYQQVKPYQERLDSDHVMDLQQLKKLHPEPSRTTLNWLNPKADIKLRFKNKKKYYAFLSKLRTYPRHEAHNYNFADQTSENTIAFLGKQTVYSSISLKPVELAAQSLQGEPSGTAQKGWFQSQHYVYFRPQATMTLLRTDKASFNKDKPNQAIAEALATGQAEEVVSLDEFYQILKNHDTDERVSQYLRKVQNGRVQYLFSSLTFDRQQNTIAVMLDLIGTKKQYCLLVKNLALPNKKSIPIFNVRPQAVFSADGTHVCYVQRSPQGGWTQLVFRRTQSCWAGQGELIKQEKQGDQLIFRCEAEKQLRVGTDSNRSYIFLAIRNCQQEFSQALFLVDKKQQSLDLIQLDRGQKCKYYFDVCPLGILLAQFHPNNSFLKFGKNPHFATTVQLIPLKQHIQLAQQKIGLNDGLLPFSENKQQIIAPGEFDVANKRTIFRAGQNQFITEVQTRSSHLITVLNLYSVYDRAVLSFLPFKPTAHPHSLLLAGGASLSLRKNNHTFHTQDVQFSRPYGCLSVQNTYCIWKKELSDSDQQRSRFHYEKLTIQGDYPIQLAITTRTLYAEEANLPIVIFFPSKGEELEGGPARQLLEKGIRIAEFRGRGTFTQDLSHFLAGSRSNFTAMMDDLQTVIEFIGNHLTKNISIYCKGEVSSLVGLWFNIYFPFLFNASVLHNGLYDLSDHIQMQNLSDFFGEVSEQTIQKWSKFDIFKQQFKHAFLSQQQQGTIGSLQNIIISSGKQHRVHCRKLIHRLRQNSTFRYEQVYLKQYENELQADVFNLSYLYAKIRTRMEQQQNNPEYYQQQMETKQEGKEQKEKL